MYSNLRKQEEYVRKLTNDEKNSLNWYTGGNYDKFNEAMRSGKELSKIQIDNKKNIDSSFIAVPPLESSIIVYKGKSSERIYSDKSFMSTTLLYEQTKRFTGNECCVVQITVSPGSKVLPIRSISREPDEEEVLLDRDGIMIVTGNSINRHGMKVVFATYCPRDSKSIKGDEELKRVDSSFDNQLIVEKLIELFQNDDPDFLDEDTIVISYSKVTGKKISDKDLEIIKKRLNIK